ncbi:MAG: Glycerophosphodiester phosphodiesterase, periplasmic [Paracidovorax wautersii]|uniref:glycerophosphodiester phosphodiesterase n=1 Tax=Paracidovorax wautersii TaxID=1177982 RepID=A0A7V8FSG6_9BURK|nr:MAG: Glycerophosphodiester phosphodiesterase, periplasmic [Paracidovorax wautersii]
MGTAFVMLTVTMHPSAVSLRRRTALATPLVFSGWLGACTSTPPAVTPWEASGGAGWPPVPALYGHRGASALRPEHTLEAYRLAIADGADFIEPDLVITRDGVLVARHENAIAILNADGSLKEATTDVVDRPAFASRKATKTIDGERITGWFVEDFTLAELKTLRARERIPAVRPANTVFDGQFEIPTLQEVIDLARRESRRLGRTIGIAPETKHPTFFQSIGLPLEAPLVAQLTRNGLNRQDAPVVIQSFEVGNLQALRPLTPVRLAQLVDDSGSPYDFVARGQAAARTYASMLTPQGLREIKAYADVLAPYKSWVIPVRDGVLGQPTSLVADAHAAGLPVVIWTLRPENRFLPASLKAEPRTDARARGDSVAEILAYLRAGVDGFFSDDSAVGRRAIKAFQRERAGR